MPCWNNSVEIESNYRPTSTDQTGPFLQPYLCLEIGNGNGIELSLKSRKVELQNLERCGFGFHWNLNKNWIFNLRTQSIQTEDSFFLFWSKRTSRLERTLEWLIFDIGRTWKRASTSSRLTERPSRSTVRFSDVQRGSHDCGENTTLPSMLPPGPNEIDRQFKKNWIILKKTSLSVDGKYSPMWPQIFF